MITRNQFGFNTFRWGTLHAAIKTKECTDYQAGPGFEYFEFKRLSFRREDLAGLKLAVKLVVEGIPGNYLFIDK